MALITCDECESQVSDKAASCPKCGAPVSPHLPQILPDLQTIQPYQQAEYAPPPLHQINVQVNAPAQIRYISTLLFLGVLFFPPIFVWFLLRKGHTTFARVAGFAWLILVLGAASSKNHESSSTTPSDSSTQSSAPVEVSALQLFADYHRNEVAADEIYKGKLLLVNGRVSDISKGIGNDMYLSLQTGEMFESVRANLNDSEKHKAANLEKGADVYVKCTGGTMIIGSPILNDCIIVDQPQLSSSSQAAQITTPSPVSLQQTASTESQRSESNALQQNQVAPEQAQPITSPPSDNMAGSTITNQSATDTPGASNESAS